MYLLEDYNKKKPNNVYPLSKSKIKYHRHFRNFLFALFQFYLHSGQLFFVLIIILLFTLVFINSVIYYLCCLQSNKQYIIVYLYAIYYLILTLFL